MSQIHQVLLPTGKSYIGIGTQFEVKAAALSSRLYKADFVRLPEEQQRQYTIRFHLLFESKTCSTLVLETKREQFVRQHKTNDPEFGYNL